MLAVCSELTVVETKLTDLSEILEQLQMPASLLPASPADVCYLLVFFFVSIICICVRVFCASVFTFHLR